MVINEYPSGVGLILVIRLKTDKRRNFFFFHITTSNVQRFKILVRYYAHKETSKEKVSVSNHSDWVQHT